MDRFQKNIVRSFRKVKEDMRNLQAQITDLCRKQEELTEMLQNTGSVEVKKRKNLKSGKKKN